MQNILLGGLMTSISRKAQIYVRSHPQTDLILTDQPNLSVNSEVHASLHPNCHHQIVHTKFNLDISYRPPYQRLLWDYKKADFEKIRKVLDLVN